MPLATHAHARVRSCPLGAVHAPGERDALSRQDALARLASVVVPVALVFRRGRARGISRRPSHDDARPARRILVEVLVAILRTATGTHHSTEVEAERSGL